MCVSFECGDFSAAGRGSLWVPLGRGPDQSGGPWNHELLVT